MTWPLFVRVGRRIGWTKKRVDIENRYAVCPGCTTILSHPPSFSAHTGLLSPTSAPGIRLDLMGILLTFVVAILTVGTSPAQTSLVLSYIISVQQAFG